MGEYWIQSDGTYQARLTIDGDVRTFPTERQAKVYAQTGQSVTIQEAAKMAAATPTSRWKAAITDGTRSLTTAWEILRGSERYWSLVLSGLAGLEDTDLVEDTGMTKAEIIEFAQLWESFRAFGGGLIDINNPASLTRIEVLSKIA